MYKVAVLPPVAKDNRSPIDLLSLEFVLDDQGLFYGARRQ